MDELNTFCLQCFSTSHLIAIFAVFVGLSFFIKGRRRRFLLSKLPSPPGRLPILGHILRLNRREGPFFESFFNEVIENARDFSKDGMFYLKLGPIDMVHVYSPEAFQEIMSSREHSTKSSLYSFTKSWLGSGLITSNGSKWSSDRKLLTPTFHLRNLEQFNAIIERHARALCEVIAKLDGEVKDMNQVMTLVALDSMCETTFGLNMELQTKGDNVYTKNVRLFCQLMTRRIRGINSFLNDTFYAMTPDGRKTKVAVEEMKQFTGDIIAKRRDATVNSKSSDEKLKCLLDLLLELHFEGHMTLDEVRYQLDTFAFAGHETVAITMTFALLRIAVDEDIQSRVHAELDEVLGSSNGDTVAQSVMKLEYLEMVIKETMRLHPPAPMIARNLEREVKIGDHVLPADSDVWMNIQALHMNDNLFPEPETFDPDRFSAENVKSRHPFAYTPFSGGLRNCIGQKYAMNVMKITLATILKRFKVFPVTTFCNFVPIFELVLKPSAPIVMTFKEREKGHVY